MRKYLFILPIFLLLLGMFVVFKNRTNNNLSQSFQPSPTPLHTTDMEKENNASIANPASKFCEENGGSVEIVTKSDGSQFGLCDLGEYSCDEWTYFRGECDIEGDSKLIKNALIAKGLDLNGMKIVIYKHLGDYISGGVVPVAEPGGGGYVFAKKTPEGMKIVADGNGVIVCSIFNDYPDFSNYLIPECFDEDTSTVIQR